MEDLNGMEGMEWTHGMEWNCQNQSNLVGTCPELRDKVCRRPSFDRSKITRAGCRPVPNRQSLLPTKIWPILTFKSKWLKSTPLTLNFDPQPAKILTPKFWPWNQKSDPDPQIWPLTPQFLDPWGPKWPKSDLSPPRPRSLTSLDLPGSELPLAGPYPPSRQTLPVTLSTQNRPKWPKNDPNLIKKVTNHQSKCQNGLKWPKSWKFDLRTLSWPSSRDNSHSQSYDGKFQPNFRNFKILKVKIVKNGQNLKFPSSRPSGHTI